ncbi:MAG: DNA methyltransferase [Gemmatimonadales bacterium]|nr:DNA methyltransferase [Gemmatimonadales bacterium]
MPKIHSVPISLIQIGESRQRREFKPEDLVKLADSISQNGLLHPVVVRREGAQLILVAGERRIRAMKYVWNFGQTVQCGGEIFPEDHVPCLDVGEMDPIDAFEAELEENIRRADLSWQERVKATNDLMELRKMQADQRGTPAPTVNTLAIEIHGETTTPGQASGGALDQTRKELIVSRYLDDPDVKKASSADDAFKVIKRKEAAKKHADLAAQLGPTFTSSQHTLLQGDCIEVMRDLVPGTFDVILTDPPYGIDAHEFGDSGARTGGAHFYDDSFDTWVELMRAFASISFNLAKPAAHAYVFCDVVNFEFLKGFMKEAGWDVFRTPLIWVNPTAMRAPWPENGPQRKWQACLYAMKGKRPVTRLYPDVITVKSDENLGHQAQKPVDLYADLLTRSVRPGDSVLDPFCGSGPIFPAAHALKCRATGIERDAAAAGIAAKRLEQLK